MIKREKWMRGVSEIKEEGGVDERGKRSEKGGGLDEWSE